jgi:hypothetical protein
MIGTILTLLFWVVWIGGAIKMAPTFAMNEALSRGRDHVHADDAVLGASRSVLWFLFGFVTYTQKAADKKLGQLPEVRHSRALTAAKMSDEMDRALGYTHNHNDEETHA